MFLNEAGEVAREEWERSALVRENVTLDVFEIMPNHLHGLIVITDANVGATRRVAQELQSKARGLQSDSAGAIIGQFKSEVTKRLTRLRGDSIRPVWQRNYYEHVIRDDGEMEAIRVYITSNPSLWQYDQDNLQRLRENVQNTRRLFAQRSLSEKQLDLIAKLEQKS